MTHKLYNLSRDSIDLIGGWIVGEIAKTIREPEAYDEIRNTNLSLMTICQEMGLNYDGIVETLAIGEEVGSDL